MDTSTRLKAMDNKSPTNAEKYSFRMFPAQIQRSLPKSLAGSNPRRASALRQKIQTRIRQARKSDLPHTLGNDIVKFTLILPLLSSFGSFFRDIVEAALIDRHMKADLEEAKVINFCCNIRPLYPLKTAGDGNCLLHAVSRGMWGIHDNVMLLRRLVYIALVEDEKYSNFKSRWMRERAWQDEPVPDGGVYLNSEEWSVEWEQTIQRAEDKKRSGQGGAKLPFESLEEIHIFVLANVLRRPIIIQAEPMVRSLGGQSFAPNNFSGIYLPLLWEPAKCVKTPLVLAFHLCHFTPLVATMRDGIVSDLALGDEAVDGIPLVTFDLSPQHVHFLLREEDNEAHLKLQNYLNLRDVPCVSRSGPENVLVAELTYEQIPEEFDLMPDFLKELKTFCAKSFTSQTTDVKDRSQVPDLDEDVIEFVDGADIVPRLFLLHARGKGENDGEITKPPSQLQQQQQQENPPPSPVQVAAPYCSQPRKVSMTDHPCDHPGCDVFATRLTRPFCSEHCPATVWKQCPSLQAVLQRTFSVDEPPSPEKMEKRLTPPLNRMRSHSIDEDDCRNGCPCRESGCAKYGLPKLDHRCADHYKFYNMYNLQTGLKTSPSPTDDEGWAWHRCRQKGCGELGDAHYAGHCAVCYARSGCDEALECPIRTTNQEHHNIDVSTQTSLKSLSLTPGRTASVDAEKGTQTTPPGGGGGGSNLSSKAHLSSTAGKTTSHASGRESYPSDKYFCANPGCADPRTDNERGLCHLCELAVKQRTTRQSVREDFSHLNIQGPPVTEPLDSTRLEPSADPCRGPQCKAVGRTEYNGLCKECYGILSHQKRHQPRKQVNSAGAAGSGEGPPKCLTKDCSMYGTANQLGLCSKCFQQRSTENNKVQNKAASNTARPSQREPAVADIVAKLCKTPGCDRFGDKCYAGLCSVCYKHQRALAKPCCTPEINDDHLYHRPAAVEVDIRPQPGRTMIHMPPLSTSVAPPAEQVTQQQPWRNPGAPNQIEASVSQWNLKRLELASKTSVRSCKTRGCPNYGNPRCKGFCNACRPPSPEYRDTHLLSSQFRA